MQRVCHSRMITRSGVAVDDRADSGGLPGVSRPGRGRPTPVIPGAEIEVVDVTFLRPVQRRMKSTRSAAPRRRAGRPRMTQSAPTPAAPTRGRRPRLSGDALVVSLAEMVDLLIKENRQLKRALARAERAQGSADQGQAARALSELQRRLARALDSSTPTRRPRSTTTAAASTRTRRELLILRC